MRLRVPSARRARGFSLIEILVGLTLGFIAIVVMYQVFAVFEAQRRTSTTGSDAQTSGLIGLFSIERDVRSAGYGLVYNKAVDDATYNGQVPCTSLAYFQGGAKKVSTPFLPVRIEDNVGPNGSDRISVAYSGHPLAATPMLVAKKVPDAGSATPNTVFVSNAPPSTLPGSPTIAVANDDLVLIATPVPLPVPLQKEVWVSPSNPLSANPPVGTSTTYNGLRPCTLLQAKNVAAAPGAVTMQFDVSGGTYNPSGAVNPFPQTAGTDYISTMEDGYPAGTTSPSVVVNLGRPPGEVPSKGNPFIWNRYSVNRVVTGGNNTERYDLVAENVIAGNGELVAVSDNIVVMQAQYGITDPTDAVNCPPAVVGSVNCQTVLKWVDAKSVAGEDWANPTPGMISRIKAVRIALVARSPLAEKIDATGAGGYTGAQSCTNQDTANARGVCAWVGDATSQSPAVDLTGITDWQTYRYRVYETVIPLRNVIWGAM
jgi:type IV pilus assembly protein PilW